MPWILPSLSKHGISFSSPIRSYIDFPIYNAPPFLVLGSTLKNIPPTTDRLKDKQVPYGSYPIVQVLNGKFIGTLAVMFYNDKPYLDCAEDNDCIRCETVYGR